MIDLDDEPAVRAADPGGMLQAVASLPVHCREGSVAGRTATSLPDAAGIDSIVFCGMGGSAISGDVVLALYLDRLPVPMVVVRGSSLPAFCGPGSLAIASSYSGSTAEALAAHEELVRRGCRTFVVTSGGPLHDAARSAGSGVVRVPAGLMPRAAFGYLLFGLLGALEAIGVLSGEGAEVDPAGSELDALVQTLLPGVPTSVNQAKGVAASLGSRLPVIWGAEGFGAVAARRWKTQMNENAKVPAIASALPELDHNEVVGWSERMGDRFAVIALRHEEEEAEVALRFPPSLEIAAAAGARTQHVWASGTSRVSRLLSLVAIGDFASTYLGIARGVDPTPIDAIARLKQALAEA